MSAERKWKRGDKLILRDMPKRLFRIQTATFLGAFALAPQYIRVKRGSQEETWAKWLWQRLKP